MKKTQDLQEIKYSLQNKGICILPTDTILGIFADAQNQEAVKKIFTTKKRDFSKPLAIFVPNTQEIPRYGIETEESKLFASKNLPGAYTILLNATEYAKTKLAPLLISNDGKIGIRIPQQGDILKITQEVIICGTSVNVSGENFAIDTIPEEIAHNVDLFYDIKTQMQQQPSTIIDFTTVKPVILR